MVTVRAMASKAHNPSAITKKVFMDMEVGGNKAGGEDAVPICAVQPCYTRSSGHSCGATTCIDVPCFRYHPTVIQATWVQISCWQGS
jgi:hypothetical protein